VFNLSNRLMELEAATGKQLAMGIGVAPYDIVLAGRKAYVSNWGGRRTEKGVVTGRLAVAPGSASIWSVSLLMKGPCQ